MFLHLELAISFDSHVIQSQYKRHNFAFKGYISPQEGTRENLIEPCLLREMVRFRATLEKF